MSNSVTLWTIARQAPLSMGFPRQEYWSGFPFSSLGDLSDPGIKPESPALAGGFGTTEPPGKPHNGILLSNKKELNYAICSNIDGPRDYHSIELSQTENPRDRGAWWAAICGVA